MTKITKIELTITSKEIDSSTYVLPNSGLFISCWICLKTLYLHQNAVYPTLRKISTSFPMNNNNFFSKGKFNIVPLKRGVREPKLDFLASSPHFLILDHYNIRNWFYRKFIQYFFDPHFAIIHKLWSLHLNANECPLLFLNTISFTSLAISAMR